MGDLYLKMQLLDEDGNASQEFGSTSLIYPMRVYEPYLINRWLYESVRAKHKEITQEDLNKAIEIIILCMQEKGFNALRIDIDKFMNRERENNE